VVCKSRCSRTQSGRSGTPNGNRTRQGGALRDSVPWNSGTLTTPLRAIRNSVEMAFNSKWPWSVR
jgi:hypothetical protein